MDKGKEPVKEEGSSKDELVKTPYIDTEKAKENIKCLWVEATKKLDMFHKFMSTEVASAMSEGYMKTYHDKFGSLYASGLAAQKSAKTELHPLTPRIVFMCAMYRQPITAALKKLEENNMESVEGVVLPEGLVDEPNRMLSECPPKILHKMLRFMQNFIVIWFNIEKCQLAIEQSGGHHHH